MVEMNSIGQVYYDLLRERINSIKYDHLYKGDRLTLSGFNTTNDSKNRIVHNFQVAIQNKELSLLNNDKLLNQMSRFESKLTNTGKVTYAASRNNKDDMVMSMLIAYNAITSGSYAVH